MRLSSVLLVSAALLLGEVDDARACTCAPRAFSVPAMGALDVPTNVRELYFATDSSTSREIRLRASDGVEVEIVVRELPGYRGLQRGASIVGELRPSTSYNLWDETLGSSERVLAFTTGSGPDLVAPPTPRFESFRIDYFGDADDSSSCGARTYDIDGYLAAPRDPDIITAVLRFVASDGTIEERLLPPSPTGILGDNDETVWSAGVVGSRYCDVGLQLDEGAYVVEALTIDAAGNTSDVAATDVRLDAGCATTRPSSLGGVLVVLALVGRRRRPRR